MFVIKELGIIEIWTLDLGGRALGDSPEIGGERFRIPPLKTLITFAQSFRDSAGMVSPVAWAMAWARRWASGFLMIQAHRILPLLYKYLPFLMIRLLY